VSNPRIVPIRGFGDRIEKLELYRIYVLIKDCLPGIGIPPNLGIPYIDMSHDNTRGLTIE